jgi:hypothetical protein
MSQRSIGQQVSDVGRAIVRPFSALLGYVMKATGRAYNQTHYPGAGGDVPETNRPPRKKQRQGRRHGSRR